MRASLRILVAALCCSVLAACGDEDEKPKGVVVDGVLKTTAVSAEQLRSAMKSWADACVPLTSEYWGDVVAAKATAYDEYADYRLSGYGWKTTIEIEVKLSEKPKKIPSHYQAAGHTLWYYAGGGDKPGVLAKKAQSASLCGMTPDPKGNDVFKPVPELAAFNPPR